MNLNVLLVCLASVFGLSCASYCPDDFGEYCDGYCCDDDECCYDDDTGLGIGYIILIVAAVIAKVIVWTCCFVFCRRRRQLRTTVIVVPRNHHGQGYVVSSVSQQHTDYNQAPIRQLGVKPPPYSTIQKPQV